MGEALPLIGEIKNKKRKKKKCAVKGAIRATSEKKERTRTKKPRSTAGKKALRRNLQTLKNPPTIPKVQKDGRGKNN